MIRTDFRTRRRAERRVRAGLVFLSFMAGVPGIWGVLSPRSFFDDFPGFGFSWVAAHPPFNEHLVRDVASFYLAFAVLFVIGAVTLGPRLVRGSLIAWMLFSALHLLFHATNLDGAEGADKWGLLLSLAVVLILPLYLVTRAGKVDARHH